MKLHTIRIITILSALVLILSIFGVISNIINPTYIGNGFLTLIPRTNSVERHITTISSNTYNPKYGDITLTLDDSSTYTLIAKEKYETVVVDYEDAKNLAVGDIVYVNPNQNLLFLLLFIPIFVCFVTTLYFISEWDDAIKAKKKKQSHS